jgi:hypothetical protein
LEGYYFEYDHELAPEQRLRFARDEDAPDFDAIRAPALASTDWPNERLAKAKRNYAMEYVRTAIPSAMGLWGSEVASPLLHLTGKLIGMQFYHETRKVLGLAQDESPAGFVEFMVTMAEAQGDKAIVQASKDRFVIRQVGLRLLEGVSNVHPAMGHAWAGLVVGAAAAHNHRLTISVDVKVGSSGVEFEWTLT